MMTFDEFFKTATKSSSRAGSDPHVWQTNLAGSAECTNRLIRIPTGMGKTLGVLSVWAYHRVHCQNTNWPTRLVWCAQSGARHSIRSKGPSFCNDGKGATSPNANCKQRYAFNGNRKTCYIQLNEDFDPNKK